MMQTGRYPHEESRQIIKGNSEDSFVRFPSGDMENKVTGDSLVMQTPSSPRAAKDASGGAHGSWSTVPRVPFADAATELVFSSRSAFVLFTAWSKLARVFVTFSSMSALVLFSALSISGGGGNSPFGARCHRTSRAEGVRSWIRSSFEFAKRFKFCFFVSSFFASINLGNEK